MINFFRKSSVFITLIGLSLSTSSCFLKNFFLVLKPLEFKVIAQKGSASLSLAAYYQDPLLTLSDDIDEIENAFKVNNESSYQFIIYDAVRGLDLCEEYQNFAYVATIALGNQQLIPLKNEIKSESKIRILLNNEYGSLGKTFKKISKVNNSIELTFVNYSDLEFYNYLYNTEDDLSSMYEYCMISEPYATRLMVMKDSNLYNEEYDYYTNSKENDFDISKSQYCKSLRSLYSSNENSLIDDAFGIPQTGIFVNKDSYYKNQESFETVLSMLNAEIALKYVMDVSNTRVDFRALSEEYHDENKDENSAQTQLAYKVQFDKVGISWNEAKRLQAWHPILGKDAPFNKFVNRLEYVQDIFEYYTDDHMLYYYNYIDEVLPNSENFIKISIK